MKCTFCNKDLGTEPPYNGEDGHYHLSCHFLLTRIEEMEKKTLTTLSLLVAKALKNKNI